MAPWSDILYACDLQWWDWHEDIQFKGRMITQDRAAADKYSIEHIESRKGKGMSEDRTYINQGANSGYQAINLAYNFGAKLVILLGYDMQFTNGKSHWFGDHPNKVKSQYNDFLYHYKILSNMMPKDLQIVNCTRDTALTYFPMSELKDVI